MSVLKQTGASVWLSIVLIWSLALEEGDWGYAQTPAGLVVTGRITDASGAVVIHAKVVLTEDGSGVSLDGLTDEAGSYRLGPVSIGTYVLTVEAVGFARYQPGPIRVGGGQDAVFDVKLLVQSAMQP